MTGGARAFWLREPGVGEIRAVEVAEPGPGQVLVRTLRSAVSRGTETLVFRGGVPADQVAEMRAPFQEGDFPGPVKYGYLNVGRVEHGPWRTSSAARSSASTRTRPPTSSPPRRSCRCPRACRPSGPCSPARSRPPSTPCGMPRRSSATASPSWGAAWSGSAWPGCSAGIPGVEVTVVDVDPAKEAVAAALGAAFALPSDATGGRDLVVHTSGSADGLQLCLDLLAADGTVLDLSWYGDAEVTLRLGGAFHSRRLAIRASQVGSVSVARRGRRSTGDRLRLALDLLRDPAFATLVSGSSPFDELPGVLAGLADGSLPALCHTITYDEGGEACSA